MIPPNRMASRATELAKLLGTRAATVRLPSIEEGGWMSYVFSVSILLLVLLAILLVVHFTIRPIFPEETLPFLMKQDAQLTWKAGPVAADLSANVTRILPNSFTVQQDIYIESETILSSSPRVFFYRSLTPITPPSSVSSNYDLLQQFPRSNLIMYLLPNTNDLVVSAVTQKSDEEFFLESAPTILNVPVRQPFRLTVVLLPQVLEVYLNGKLFGTKTFRYPLLNSNSYFFGPPNVYRTTVRTMNFSYWDRPLSSLEIKQAGPALASTSSFSPATGTTACAKGGILPTLRDVGDLVDMSEFTLSM
jgi:hypothetical protein